jgi:hypothetical protein
MQLKTALIALLYLVILSTTAFAANTPDQKSGALSYSRLMHVAYQEGVKIGYPETLQAILLRETNGGRYRGSAVSHRNNQCYGVMQIRFDTAKFVLTTLWRVPKSDLPSDTQLRRKIRDDDAFNVKIAASYFKYLISMHTGSAQWEKAVVSYNTGASSLPDKGRAYERNGYVRAVRRLMTTDVGRFNSLHGIGEEKSFSSDQ